MMTVRKVSELSGVSVRTLQYYDKIGLLIPSSRSEAGYRLYNNDDLEKLQQILIFRELEFSLKDIKRIMNSPDFDRNSALDQQIRLLELKKQHLENLILFASGIKILGVRAVDFSRFNRSKFDEYSKKAKAHWGNTQEYKEFQEHEKNRSQEENDNLIEKMMYIFTEFGEMRSLPPGSDAVQAQVKKLKDFISCHFYTCSDNILAGLRKMYAAGGEISDNIDSAGGKGTADFTAAAIEIFCSK